MNIATAASIGSVAIAFLALLFSFISNLRNSTKDDTSQMVAMLTKLDGISDDLRDLKKDVAGLRGQIQDNHDRVLILERDTATMWKRIDEIRAQLKSS